MQKDTVDGKNGGHTESVITPAGKGPIQKKQTEGRLTRNEPAKEKKLLKVPEGELKCEVASEIVLGYVDGESYFGRNIAMVRSVPSIFGEGILQRKSPRRYTVHNGIINHCDIREGRCPTPYWAVMDAMSELGSFDQKQVVDLAVNNLKKMGCTDSRLELTGKCDIAFTVLVTHHRHPTKNRSGMSFMCDKEPRGDGPQRWRIRGRRRDETLEHFLSLKGKFEKAKKDGSAIMDVKVENPV